MTDTASEKRRIFSMAKLSFTHSLLLCILMSFCSESKAQLPCVDHLNLTHKNRTVIFDLISKKNQTGHWITKFSVNNESPQLPNNWKVHMEHNVDFHGGLERFRLQGSLIVPPPLPAGYTLFPGVGYYKVYSKSPGGWDEAYATCAKEGSHLAIVSSQAEFNVIRSLSNGKSLYLGFHDRIKEGEFVTIFGEPLSSTGFEHWLTNQPDNGGGREHCGSYHPEGGFNDLPCQMDFPFICEYDLSWAD